MANRALTEYIAAARAKDHDDDQIRRDLVDAGWDPKLVAAGLKPDNDLPVPLPQDADLATTHSSRPAHHHPDAKPQPVVQNLSTRGLEYIIMFIALAVAAISLGSILHSSINSLFGSTSSFLDGGGRVSFASSALIVSLPVLAFLFLRLKKAELSDPELQFDPSRKRAVQITLVVTFLVGLGNIIYFVYSLMSGAGGRGEFNTVGSSASYSLLGNFVHLVITLAIAGSIFIYYWRDEHTTD